MNEPQQLSFADAEYANKGKITRREKFLGQLEGLLPWLVMMTVIEPHFSLKKTQSRTLPGGTRQLETLAGRRPK